MLASPGRIAATLIGTPGVVVVAPGLISVSRTTLTNMTTDISDTPVDIKPRSRDVTDGIQKAAARAMLRAVGLTEDDWVKSQIGIASSWNEITPCNASIRRLTAAAKEGVREAGGVALEFGTITVSDGI